jgi:hypothetical protein
MDVAVTVTMPTKDAQTYACIFRMAKRPWHGGIIIFEDGQATVCRARAHPDRPLIIELEGDEPNDEQLKPANEVWKSLSKHFNFSVASFCSKLEPHIDAIRK